MEAQINQNNLFRSGTNVLKNTKIMLKIMTKSLQSDAEMILKSPKTNPTNIPKSSQITSKNHPKII